MRWFRYCRHALLDEAVALGWVIVDTPLIAHHDFYSLILEWPTAQDDPPPWPE